MLCCGVNEGKEVNSTEEQPSSKPAMSQVLMYLTCKTSIKTVKR